MQRYITIMTVEDDGFTFLIPDLPGFMAQCEGDDATAAMAEAQEVLGHFLGAMRDRGLDIPAPSGPGAVLDSRAWTDHAASSILTHLDARPIGGRPVRVNISMDSYTLDAIDSSAAARGLTRSAYLAEAARQYG